MHTIDQFFVMEINEQTEGYIHKFHITQELGLVYRKDLLDSLQLYQQAAFNEHIDSKWRLKSQPLVFDGNDEFAFGRNLAQLQFSYEAPLVDFLQEPRSFFAVHFNRSAYDAATQLICMLKEGVHLKPA